MKIHSGISVLALLLAGAASPSFATTLSPGGTVSPVPVVTSFGTVEADTGVVAFSFGGDTGYVQEIVGTNSINPFGANDLAFVYQISVTGGHIVNLTGENWNLPGIQLDVTQDNVALFALPNTRAVSASLTSDGTTLGFSFATPDGLISGDNSYLLVVNTNLTTYEDGIFSLQDGATGNFNGFVPGAAPEPGSLALLGTGLLGFAGVARRKFFGK